ncbi:MAG: hypothetical protein RL238_398 [Actinomycetota bacterium]|jgi:hypothetical protein
MWLLPRLRLAFARRPWSYWFLVAVAAAVTWWRIAALHDDAQHRRDAWGTAVTVWVVRDDTADGAPLRAERRSLPTAAVPSEALRDLADDAVAARDLVAGEVVVPADVVGDRTTPEGWVVVSVEARAPQLVAGDAVTVFEGGRVLCDGTASGGGVDGAVELAVPAPCAATLSAAAPAGDIVVGRRA